MKNIYLIKGDDDYQIKFYKNKILKQINPKDENEIIIYDLLENDFSNIFNDFWTNSLFFNKRIFILENLEILFKKDNKDDYINYLMKLNDNQNIFILIWKNNRVISGKLMKKFISEVNVYNTQNVDSNVIIRFITQYTASNNASIDEDALDYILGNSPNSLSIIKFELDKIFNISKVLNLQLVKNNFTVYFTGDVFKLANSIFEKNLNNFYKNYLYLKNLSNIENIITSIIFEKTRLIKIIKIMYNKSDDYILDVLKIHPYRLKLLKKISYNYDIDDLDNIVKIIYDYEINKSKVKNLNDYFHLMLFKIYKVGDNLGSKQII